MDTQGCFEQYTHSTSSSLTTIINSNSNNSTNNNTNNNNNNNSNYSILALSTILSCVQFYNVCEIIPEEAIQALKFFTEYEKLALTEAPQFAKSFQV